MHSGILIPLEHGVDRLCSLTVLLFVNIAIINPYPFEALISHCVACAADLVELYR